MFFLGIIYMKIHLVELLVYLLGLCVIISLIILIQNISSNKIGKINSYNTWQFPMLLALFLDAVYFSLQ